MAFVLSMARHDLLYELMKRILLFVAWIFISGLPANAHPHIFVDADGGFVFNDAGHLVGVRVFWLYDAYTTLFLYDSLDLDEDGDGALNAADLERIRHGETSWEPGYEGDTYLWIDGKKQILSYPKNSSAQMVKGRVGVSFELHLRAPQEMAGRSASLKLYDPIYYYAYSIPNEGRIFGPAAGCDVWVNRFDPDDQTAELQKKLGALSREDMPEDLDIGAKFAEEIALKCD